MHLKMSFGKCQRSCLGLNVLWGASIPMPHYPTCFSLPCAVSIHTSSLGGSTATMTSIVSSSSLGGLGGSAFISTRSMRTGSLGASFLLAVLRAVHVLTLSHSATPGPTSARLATSDSRRGESALEERLGVPEWRSATAPRRIRKRRILNSSSCLCNWKNTDDLAQDYDDSSALAMEL